VCWNGLRVVVIQIDWPSSNSLGSPFVECYLHNIAGIVIVVANTHTASTATSNVVENASLYGRAGGTASGMRYTSRISVYKVCWPKGCANSNILATVDQAVFDGVDVLSLSLGSDPKPFYDDFIAIASFGETKKGIFVTCSTCKEGPSPSTVSNGAPWIMTVVASSTDRSFPAEVKLGN